MHSSHQVEKWFLSGTHYNIREMRDRKLHKADNEEKQDVYTDFQVSAVLSFLR